MKSFNQKLAAGFTLIELITVIVILGVLAGATTTFIKFSTQIYSETTARDQLVSSARFAIERLNREVRNALPNSIKITNANQCLEFIPIIESTIYTDIPVLPESSSNTISVIAFTASFDSNWQAIVYPLTNDDVYASSGKKHAVGNTIDTSTDEWVITLENTVVFDEDSPTQRIYFIDETDTVAYCLLNNTLTRNGILMAQNIYNTSNPFMVYESTLQRNAMVQINLRFEKNDERITFNNEVQVLNVP